MRIIQPIEGQAGPRRILDRAKWHLPLCSVIVTHYNYSHLIRDALLSLLDQTHQNWECVIVDDCSTEEHWRRLLAIVEDLQDRRFRVIQNAEQLGQIGTFFGGLIETRGEFVSPLDPDDRLDQSYIEEMVNIHLNEIVFCPIVSCEQRLLSLDNDAIVTGTWKGRLREESRLQATRPKALGIKISSSEGPLVYFSPKERNWLWSASSSLMIRRSALNLLVPNKRLGLNSLDTYLANGAHFLGGTLFLSKALVYRGVHSANDYLTSRIVSMRQQLGRDGWTTRAPQCKRALVEAIFHNGITSLFSERYLAEVLRAHFDEEQIMVVAETCPEAFRLWRLHDPNLRCDSRLRRWRRRARRALLGA